MKNQGGHRPNTKKIMRAKEGKILEAEACPYHVAHVGKHTFAHKRSAVYGVLKMEKQMIFGKYAKLKHKYANRVFGS